MITAIDSGKNGGVAFQRQGEMACAVKMPSTEGDLIELLRSLRGSTFYLENLVKHMGGGVPASTMAVYASNWGFIKGAIQMQGDVLNLVTPQEWVKGLGLGKRGDTSKVEWKNKLKSHAQRVYPHLKITLATSDALCILDYATKL